MADDISRLGNEAEYILSSEAFRKAMTELDEGIVEMWAAGLFKTAEEREDAYNRVRGARMFKERLNSKAQAERRVKLRSIAGSADE
jgi:predicted TPR repeat methyltransferase